MWLICRWTTLKEVCAQPDTVRGKSGLALMREEEGKFDEAEKKLAEAIEAEEKGQMEKK